MKPSVVRYIWNATGSNAKTATAFPTNGTAMDIRIVWTEAMKSHAGSKSIWRIVRSTIDDFYARIIKRVSKSRICATKRTTVRINRMSKEVVRRRRTRVFIIVVLTNVYKRPTDPCACARKDIISYRKKIARILTNAKRTEYAIRNVEITTADTHVTAIGNTAYKATTEHAKRTVSAQIFYKNPITNRHFLRW